jgi:3-deoxy-D-manno-octulosonate 8-phosphate phosphatase (KDO 8-P phosphatase)
MGTKKRGWENILHSMSFEVRRRIDYIFTDCDGVLTDNSVFVFENGTEARRYNTIDAQAIQKAKKSGVEVVFITAEKKLCHKYRAEKLGCVHIRSDNKYADILRLYGQDVSYAAVGDSEADEGMLLGAVQGFGFVPKDSCFSVRGYNVINKKGGDGLLADVVESVILYNHYRSCVNEVSL